MGVKAPELIYVDGPQKGERVYVVAAESILGRTAQCEICAREEFVSRRQLRLAITTDGVVVENLSANGTEINGKRYKAGKKILLATGDVLGVGIQSKLLFVAQGDDVEKALAEYRRKVEPAPAPAPLPAPAPGGPPPRPSTSAKVATAGEALGAPTANWANKPLAPAIPALSPSGEASAARKKLRKYMKFGIVYAVVLAAIFGVGVYVKNTVKTPDGSSPSDEGYLLSREDITKILEEKLPRKMDPLSAQRALKTAGDLFPRRKSDPGNLFRVVSDYNAYLAGKEGPGVFEDADDLRKYDQALRELKDAVIAKYENGYANERNKDFVTAKRIFGELLEMLPVKEKSPAQEKLIPNIMKHLTYVSRKAGK